MSRLLIIEDDERLAFLLQRSLKEEGFDVFLAYDGEMGCKLAIQQDFDLLISDLVLPKMNGLDLCKTIRQQKPELPILMLTALGTTDDKIEGFDAGADDYLVKPFEMRELKARIKVLLKRQVKRPVLHEDILRYADIELNQQTKEVKRDAQQLSLTPKEFHLLAYMLKNPERILSRAELAENVWETHYDTGTNFIDVYINYLRKKVDKPFEEKLIHTKSGMGFILKKS